MIDFTHELLVRAVLAEREREVKAIARAAEGAGRRRGLRASFAARLARLALWVDREAARFSLSREAGRPATNGSPT